MIEAPSVGTLTDGERGDYFAIGRIEDLPDEARRDPDAAVTRTEANTGMHVNLAINYGGRTEIVDAVNALLEDARRGGYLNELRVDEDAIASRLYTAHVPDPDLLIRTSGELRVSNFLLWQIAYAEIYVTETLWPDFRTADLLTAILEYQKRDRRFGGLTPRIRSQQDPVSSEHMLPVSSR